MQATGPAMLEIDLDAPEAAPLLAATASAHGALLIPAARRLSRLFLLRSPWAPGLRFAGAQAVYECEGDRRSFSFSGPSETLEGAVAAVIGEAVEVLSQMERAGDAQPDAVSSAVPLLTGVSEILDEVPCVRACGSRSLDWMIGRRVGGGDDVRIPADWCVRRTPSRVKAAPPWAIGSGVAAGPAFDWAASRALLELIERDAAALWWRGGRRGRPIRLDDPAMAEAARLSSGLRQGMPDRATWLVDITTDIAVPVVAAISCNDDGRDVAVGFGARLGLPAAVCGALLENAQMELGLLLARAKDGGASPGADTSKLERAIFLNAAACDLLHPSGAPLRHARPADGAELPQLAAALSARGIDAALVDLTRPDFGIPVMRAISPQLQPSPSHRVTQRLRAVMAANGGADRLTAGISLF